MSIPLHPESEPALPAYTHIPGITPHPLGDPRGHSFGHVHPACPTPDWQGLPDNRLFQHGRRLFNAGYYWEAHEAWEGVWIAAGRSGLVADFVKGLIKLAAAGVKVREGSAVGAQRHLARAEELFLLTVSRLSEPTSELERLLIVVRSLAAGLPATPEPNAGKPVAVLGRI
ncbi:MAG: hypothetical protein JWN70_6670 [Planctomycetaceae bacterium]|nr:hypothetical protein [Planctomycetaceae bacterium]